MSRHILAPAAVADIEAILTRTEEQFGSQARIRYQALLIRAIADVADRPNRGGSRARAELAASARTYHLDHSKNHVTVAAGRVKRPRHFLLYRVRNDGIVEIGRVLHDSMDLRRHLPDAYQAESED